MHVYKMSIIQIFELFNIRNFKGLNQNKRED